MHFRLKSISILSSLKLRSRYLISIALELFIEMTPRRSSLLNTLLGLRDRLAAMSSMEFPASRDSTSWFSSAWLHRLFAMTGLGICESWYTASESFLIAKRKASWISTDKNLDFWSAKSRFLDSELFLQISSDLTQITIFLFHSVKNVYVFFVITIIFEASKITSVKTIYAWCPISSNNYILNNT